MRRTLLSALALLALAFPAAAAASGNDVLIDCADNEQLSRTYSQADYQAALDLIPADGDQYTGCRAIIRAAQLRAAGGGTGDGTGGAGGAAGIVVPPPPGVSPLATASPADQAAAKAAQAAGSQPVNVGGVVIRPGDPGQVVSSLDDLPASLLAVLLGLVAGLAGVIAHLVRTRGVRRPA